MEDACIAENTARFSQAESTPPMTEPLVTDLGYFIVSIHKWMLTILTVSLR
jgi:hypothetical protein